MMKRILVLLASLLTCAVVAAARSGAEAVVAREPLATLSTDVGGWTSVADVPFEERVVARLGATEYLNRVYARPGEAMVGLYVGYYASQRQGDAIHSPLNCLPGAGWQPIDSRRLSMVVPDGTGASRPIEVNRYVVQKGLDRQVVLYWYQSHGRVVASEYTSKFFLARDALTMNRTDAALVRVMSGVTREEEPSDAAAGLRVEEFIRSIFSELSRHLPA